MRNQVVWTATRKENPKNDMPVTIVVRGLRGTHTMGAQMKDDGEWYDMYTGDMIEEEVVCWSNIEIPEEYLF